MKIDCVSVLMGIRKTLKVHACHPASPTAGKMRSSKMESDACVSQAILKTNKESVNQSETNAQEPTNKD